MSLRLSISAALSSTSSYLSRAFGTSIPSRWSCDEHGYGIVSEHEDPCRRMVSLFFYAFLLLFGGSSSFFTVMSSLQLARIQFVPANGISSELSSHQIPI